jgi:hypothetical protein
MALYNSLVTIIDQAEAEPTFNTENADVATLHEAVLQAIDLGSLIYYFVFHSDKEKRKLFFLVYSSIITSERLLDAVTKLYGTQLPLINMLRYSSFEIEENGMEQVKIGSFIREWIENSPHEWKSNEKLVFMLNHFIDDCLLRDKQMGTVKLLRNTITKMVILPSTLLTSTSAKETEGAYYEHHGT